MTEEIKGTTEDLGNDTLSSGDDTIASGDDTLVGDDTAKGEDKSSLLDTSDKDVTATAPANFPENWRQLMAGDAEGAIKTLERYKSPADVAKALLAFKSKVSSGELKSADAPEGEEELAAWRKERGIPETADAYLENVQLPGGLQVGEADKAILGKVMEAFHGSHLPQDVVNSAVGAYYEAQEAEATALREADQQAVQEAEDSLRAEWGDEYRGNVNHIAAMLDGESEGFRAMVEFARDAEGNPLFANPQFVKFMLSVAQDRAPAGKVLPAGQAPSQTNVEARLKEIKEYRMKDERAYYKDKAVLEEERNLLEALEKIQARDKSA